MLYIQIFDLERPMDWNKFKRLSLPRQVDYLQFLKVKKRFTDKQLSKMFKVHENTIQTRAFTAIPQEEKVSNDEKATDEEFEDWLSQTDTTDRRAMEMWIHMRVPKAKVGWMT